MKATEFRELTEDELLNKEEDLKDQLFKLKFQHALGQLENAISSKI
jgi:large subunit ribosomal protein L29